MKASDDWAWDRPELRAQLRIGTLLRTTDYSYMWVKDITHEGIVTAVGNTPRHLFTWKSLIEMETMIDSHPAENASIPQRWPGPFIKNRGGRVGRDEAAVLQLLQEAGSAPDVHSLDVALGAELLRIAPAERSTFFLQVWTDSDDVTAPLHFILADPNGTRLPLEETEALRRAAHRVRAFTAECQGLPWRTIDYDVARLDSGNWTYEINFFYK